MHIGGVYVRDLRNMMRGLAALSDRCYGTRRADEIEARNLPPHPGFLAGAAVVANV